MPSLLAPSHGQRLGWIDVETVVALATQSRSKKLLEVPYRLYGGLDSACRAHDRGNRSANRSKPSKRSKSRSKLTRRQPLAIARAAR